MSDDELQWILRSTKITRILFAIITLECVNLYQIIKLNCNFVLYQFTVSD